MTAVFPDEISYNFDQKIGCKKLHTVTKIHTRYVDESGDKSGMIMRIQSVCEAVASFNTGF